MWRKRVFLLGNPPAEESWLGKRGHARQNETVCMAASIGEKFSEERERERERTRVCLLENVAEVSRIKRQQIQAGL